MNSFHDLIVNRRSIRRFTDEPISPDDVKLILEAALLAPTSKSKRAWQLIAVDDKEMLKRLGACKPSYANAIEAAPLAVVVSVDSDESDVWIEDSSVAATYMQLQAEDLGLGSCWVQVRGRMAGPETTSEEYVAEALGMPENCVPVCIIAFGHKAETRKPQDLEKLKWGNVHIDKF